MSKPIADRWIYHITTRTNWLAEHPADYTDSSLDSEGFIHCSTADQLLIPANERFRGRRDLVLLKIEASALSSALVYEDCYASGLAFPHVYGPIGRHAVVGIIDFPPTVDGGFELPAELL